MQSIATTSISPGRCRSGDAKHDTLRSPGSRNTSSVVVNEDGIIDLVKQANDIKFQFRVLLDRIKL